LSKSSFPLLIEGIFGIFYQRIDVVLAGKLISTEAVAYYSVALKFVDFAIFIPLALVQTLSPLLVQKFEKVNYNIHDEEYIKFKRKLGDVVTYSGILMSAFLFLAAGPIILILYGHDYDKSIPILHILAWKGLFCGLGFSASAMIITEGRQKLVYVTNIIGGAINVSLSLILIPRIGLIGVAISTIVSFGIGTYFSNFLFPLYRIDFMFQSDFLFRGPKRLISYLNESLKKQHKQ
jgi:PST family polysaccharide transporter